MSETEDAGTSNSTPRGRKDQAHKKGTSSASPLFPDHDILSPTCALIVPCASAGTGFDIQDRAGQGLSVSLRGTWWPAMWHHHLVIGLDRNNYGPHLYDVEPPRRNDSQPVEDITTFLAGQKSWAFESKDARPSILFQLYPRMNQYPDRNKAVPWLKWEVDGVSKIVLDVISRSPLREFRNIPLQLASNVEGGRLEAMSREDSRITSKDFLQRMIPFLDENGEPRIYEGGVLLSDRPTVHELNYVKTRFRNQCRCLSWTTLRTDSVFDRRLLKDITKQDREANTTRNLPDLSPSESTAIRSSARYAEVDKGIGAGIAANDESQLDSTPNSAEQSETEVQGGKAIADVAEDGNVNALFDILLRQTSVETTENEIPVKRHRKGASRKKSEQVDVARVSSRPSVGDTVPDSYQVIDPALLAPAASQTSTEHAEQSTRNTGRNTLQPLLTTHDTPATSSPSAVSAPKIVSDPKDSVSADQATSTPSTDTQKSSADRENAVQATAATKVDPVSSINTATTEEQLGNDPPSPRRKYTNEGEDPDSDSIQVTNNSERLQRRTQSPDLSLKRQRNISPPYPTNVQELLEQFGATSRRGGAPSPLLNSRAVNTTIPFIQEEGRAIDQNPESPQPNTPDEASPATQESGTVSRSRSVSPAPAMAGPYRPIQPRPSSATPPSPMLHHNQMQALTPEQAHFAAVSDRISSLEIVKARLFNAWLEEQVDTSTGAALYGPRFNIPLSRLGLNNSARTDAEMRSFMSSYNIPENWSASSIDLRQNEGLRQAVQEAICQAAYWDARNYVENTNLSIIDLTTDGGFFLARAFWSSITPNDCRFWNFTSTNQLNASLYAAMWRYKQLTYRNFGTPGYPAFLAVETSYQDAWCEMYCQIFLPYFLRFKDPVEAACWAPELGMLAKWEGGPERWESSPTHVYDGFGCRSDVEGRGALDPRGDAMEWGAGRKVFLPLVCVDLEGGAGVE